MTTLLQKTPTRPEGLALTLLAAFFSLFYIAVALSGNPHEILQAVLAVCFVPTMLFWRDRPVGTAVTTMVLLWLWTANWISALPDNLGFTPFALFVPLVVYSTARFVKQRVFTVAFLAVALLYCFVSPIMWGQDEGGVIYLQDEQALSWLLIQWLVLMIIMQIGRSRRAAAVRLEEKHRSRARATIDEQNAIRDRERVLTAREIHDVLAHSLTLINVQASAGGMLARKDAPAGLSDQAETLENIRDISSAALTEVRGIVRALRSDFGPVSLAGMTSLYEAPEQIDKYRQTGMMIEASLPSEEELTNLSSTVPLLVQLAVRRILDESLTNVVRHQGVSSRVQISLSANKDISEISIRVQSWFPETSDGGSPTMTGTGSGLIGMRERVDSLGGWINYRDGHDYFLVTAMLPITPNS